MSSSLPCQSNSDAETRRNELRWPTEMDAAHPPLRISPARAPEGSLTPEAAAAVDVLKHKLAAEVESWNTAAAAEGAALLDDFTLHRFLLARPESVEAALGMVRTASEWRAERREEYLRGP